MDSVDWWYLDTPTHLLIEELQVALCVSGTLVLNDISIGLLQKECRKSLHGEALRLLGVLLRLHHLHIHLFSSYIDRSTLHELRKVGLRGRAVGAPVGVEHGEGGERRRMRVLEALLRPDLEAAPDGEANDDRCGQYDDNNGKQCPVPLHDTT